MDWVYENDLNNRVLFIGCTSFSVPAVGETSVLANTIFASATLKHPKVRFYGSTSPRRSILYRKCVEASKCNMTWIELPLGGIWRADDLIHAEKWVDCLPTQNSSALASPGLQQNQETAKATPAAEPKPKKKICCACPETKKLRDECIIEHGEEACAKWVEAHRSCLRAEGFNG
ncbi:Cytochrome c oxidase copper chaperone [Hibiscus syriacus]|uniref:Cytochrome c oxidase copper chaperone n=1 Tax=Hibiscus syriacus TaxID=106335 RepID=A0A6A2XF67_HIBSY|nr:Cytochrome c oxidase copper chaperone [Hibiscus syriacus]